MQYFVVFGRNNQVLCQIDRSKLHVQSLKERRVDVYQRMGLRIRGNLPIIYKRLSELRGHPGVKCVKHNYQKRANFLEC